MPFFILNHLIDYKIYVQINKLISCMKQCPRQTQDSMDCGYYICRYMLETIEKRRQGIPEQVLLISADFMFMFI